MAAQTTDLLIIERNGTKYKLTAAELLALAQAGSLPAGSIPVRYDAIQPTSDCLWISPTKQVVLITGS